MYTKLKYLFALCCLLFNLFVFAQTNDSMIERYPNGKVKAIGGLKDHERDGEWKFYYPTGTLAATEQYENGYLEGTAYYYDTLDTALMAKEQWQKGLEQDSAWYYYHNGQLKRAGIYYYGMYKGVWHTYYENGKLKTVGGYTNGTPNGIWKFYSVNGLLTEEYTYVDGVLNGPAKLYDKKGILSSSGTMEKDLPVGTWSYYNKKGKVKKTKQF